MGQLDSVQKMQEMIDVVKILENRNEVFDVVQKDSGGYAVFPMKVRQIVPFGEVHNGAVWNILLEDDWHVKVYRSFKELGRTVFFTVEDADQKADELERQALERERMTGSAGEIRQNRKRR